MEIFRVIFLIIILVISFLVNSYIYQDYQARKNIKWVKVEAEILETTLDNKMTTNSTTTRWGSDGRPVNVIVEKFKPNRIENYAVYSGISTTTNQFQVQARYKYTYSDGQVYEMWNAATGYVSQLEAQNSLLNYPKGKKIMVYVQEQNPQVSQIITPDKSFSFSSFLMANLFTLLFVFIAIYGDLTPTIGTTVYVSR